MKRLILTSAFASILLAAACSETTTVDLPTDGNQLPCDVAEMLQERCQQCHASETKFGAPMPLVGHSDLVGDALSGGGSVAEVAVARMTASDDRMPPPPNEAASAAEISLLQQWIDAGSPKRAAGEQCNGSGGNGGGGGAGGSDPGCTPDVSLGADTPFEMPANSVDEQVCVGITISGFDAKRHITAIAPRIDNSKIIHHILLMQSPTPVSPTPTSCNFTQLDWKLLYAWGPGTPAHILPDEAGFPLEESEDVHFVLQIHYNNLQGLVGELDQSGVDLCTTDELRTHDADIMAFGGAPFNGIAPGATSELDCNMPIPAEAGPLFPVTIFQAWPHMHQLGASQRTEILHQGGGSTMLSNVDDYEFEYQITYPTNVELGVGDTIHTTCAWDNPSDNAVNFGEDTQDEMCFNFVSYYPRINFAQWHWLLPAYQAQCDMSVK